MTESLSKLYAKWQAAQPLPEKDRQRLERKFMLDFNFNSNHIEGNTLTYGQTEVLLLLGETMGRARMRDLEEMKAHNVCLHIIQDEARCGRPLTEMFLRQLHQVLLVEDYTVHRQLPGGVNTSYVVHAGCYKTRPNSVITPSGERFDYASPEETPALMQNLVEWYNYAEQNRLMSPLELAALFHYRYIRIHPFEDGNGRIARLVMNLILLRHGWPMVVVPSAGKRLYLQALSEADALTGKQPVDGANARLECILGFVKYMEALMEATIIADLEYISAGSAATWWYNGEAVHFRSPNTPRILLMLLDNPKTSTTEMASALGINRSAVQKQMKTLEQKGYILRVPDSTQWRVIIINK